MWPSRQTFRSFGPMPTDRPLLLNEMVIEQYGGNREHLKGISKQ